MKKNNLETMVSKLRIGLCVSLLGMIAQANDGASYLAKQKGLNTTIFSIHIEDAKRAQKGSVSRANLSVINTTKTDEQNIADLIEKRILPAAPIVCSRESANVCAAKIVKKDAGLSPKTQVVDGIAQYVELLKARNLSEKWNLELASVEDTIKDLLGNDFDEYMIGYTDSDVILNFILLSKDRTRAMVIIADIASH